MIKQCRQSNSECLGLTVPERWEPLVMGGMAACSRHGDEGRKLRAHTLNWAGSKEHELEMVQVFEPLKPFSSDVFPPTWPNLLNLAKKGYKCPNVQMPKSMDMRDISHSNHHIWCAPLRFFTGWVVLRQSLTICRLGAHCVDKAGLELWSSCLSLSSAGVKVVCCHTRLFFFFIGSTWVKWASY